MNEFLEKLLVDGMKELGVRTEAILPALKLYFSEILLWNPKLGLIEADEKDIILKHFLDSASALPVFRSVMDDISQDRDISMENRPLSIADLGSGAGLPGIILALVLREEFPVEVHLVEKQQRRCGFLRNVVPILGLDSLVSIHQCNFEQVGRRFDLVTSRAFRNLDGEQIAIQRGLLNDGGRIIAYKGRVATIEKELGEELSKADIIPVKVPGLDSERHIVVV